METTTRTTLPRIQVSRYHGRKIDLICRNQSRSLGAQVELWIDGAFATLGLSLPVEGDSAGNGKNPD